MRTRASTLLRTPARPSLRSREGGEAEVSQPPHPRRLVPPPMRRRSYVSLLWSTFFGRYLAFSTSGGNDAAGWAFQVWPGKLVASRVQSRSPAPPRRSSPTTSSAGTRPCLSTLRAGWIPRAMAPQSAPPHRRTCPAASSSATARRRSSGRTRRARRGTASGRAGVTGGGMVVQV